MVRTFMLAAAAVLALAGCSSSPSTPAGAPASTTPPASTVAGSATPSACDLTSTGDVIERIVTPNGPATAVRVGSVDLANCATTFSMLAKETSTDAGFCTTAAWAADNPGYNVDATPAAPLRNVQAQAGAGC